MTRAHIQARTLTDPGEMRQAVYAEGLRPFRLHDTEQAAQHHPVVPLATNAPSLCRRLSI